MRPRSCRTPPLFMTFLFALGCAALAAAQLPALADGGYGDDGGGTSSSSSHHRNAYTITVLDSDGATAAPNNDPNLVNGWGIAHSPTQFWWVSDNGTGHSSLYDSTGALDSLVVDVPGSPTGVVFYGGDNFLVSDSGDSGPSRFLFANENGTVSGWNLNVPLPSPSTASHVVIDSTAAGAIYKGIAIGSSGGNDRLYVTDFHNARVDVFDGTFAPVSNAGAFVDPKIPDGYAPFGIQNINGNIFVTYAKQDAQAEDDVKGQGRGFISAFDPDGILLGHLAAHGRLNAPWGMALAPDDFGKFSNDLLVSNFGDGKIVAFQLTTSLKKALPRGVLKKTNKKPVVIDGLWGIGFGNGGSAGPTNTLFFAAGPADESHGLFGKIEAAP